MSSIHGLGTTAPAHSGEGDSGRRRTRGRRIAGRGPRPRSTSHTDSHGVRGGDGRDGTDDAPGPGRRRRPGRTDGDRDRRCRYLRVHLFFTQQAAAVALRRALGPSAADRLVEFDAFVPHLRSAADVTATDALLQCRGDAGAPHVISEFVSARDEHPRGLALASVVTTVDALTLWDMLVAPALYRRRNPGASLVATATQIEHATVVVFTAWTSLAVDDLHLLVALVGHLNPAATVVLLGADAPLVLDRHGFDDAEASLNRAGWMHVLSDTFAPRSVHARVSTFRYQNLPRFIPAVWLRCSMQVRTRLSGRMWYGRWASASLHRAPTRWCCGINVPPRCSSRPCTPTPTPARRNRSPSARTSHSSASTSILPGCRTCWMRASSMTTSFLPGLQAGRLCRIRCRGGKRRSRARAGARRLCGPGLVREQTRVTVGRSGSSGGHRIGGNTRFSLLWPSLRAGWPSNVEFVRRTTVFTRDTKNPANRAHRSVVGDVIFTGTLSRLRIDPPPSRVLSRFSMRGIQPARVPCGNRPGCDRECSCRARAAIRRNVERARSLSLHS